jgi:HEPN domain-containing protein
LSLGRLDVIDHALLEFAKEDFRTGEILINHKINVTALYYFEQCFEKVVKSYYIFIMKNNELNIEKLYEKTKDLGHDVNTSTIELLLAVANLEKDLFQKKRDVAIELTPLAIDFFKKGEMLNEKIQGYIDTLINLKNRDLDKEFIKNIKNYESFVGNEHQKYLEKRKTVKGIKNDMSNYSYNFVAFSDTSIYLYPCLYNMNEVSRYPLKNFEFDNLKYLNNKRAVNLVKNMIRIMVDSYNWIRKNYDLTTVYSYKIHK